MGKLKAGQTLLKIDIIASFICAGLLVIALLVMLIIGNYLPAESKATYNTYLIVLAICIIPVIIGAVLSIFCLNHPKKPLIIITLVFGVILEAPLMVIGCIFLLLSLDYLMEMQRIPKIDDETEEDTRLVVLARQEKKKYHSSSWNDYKNMWKKKSVGEKITLSIMLVIFLIYGFSLLFPLIWALYNSFKTTTDYDMDSFRLPLEWTVKNYEQVFTTAAAGDTNIPMAIFNSVWMSLLSTFLGLFASCLTSYVVAKYRFKTSTLIYTVAIFIQIIPLVGGITGMYQLLWGTLQIANNPFLIWPIWFGGFGFSFLMLYSAFKSVPWSYAESAFIDGAGHFTTFIRIMLPSVKPILASLFVVNFIGAWNDYMTAYLYMPNWAPLSLAVYLLKDDATRISYPVYLAVVVVSVIPIIALFISFQKLIMENTTVGGLKG